MYEELISRLQDLATLEVKNGESYLNVTAEATVAIREIAQEAADAIENTSKAFQMMAEAYEAEVAVKEIKTNGDKVRAMTDEQLAQFILNTIARICAKVGKKNEASIKENFDQAGLYCQFEIWLKERAEE